MTDVDRKRKNIVVRCLRPYKGYGLLRESPRGRPRLRWKDVCQNGHGSLEDQGGKDH